MLIFKLKDTDEEIKIEQSENVSILDVLDRKWWFRKVMIDDKQIETSQLSDYLSGSIIDHVTIELNSVDENTENQIQNLKKNLKKAIIASENVSEKFYLNKDGDIWNQLNLFFTQTETLFKSFASLKSGINNTFYDYTKFDALEHKILKLLHQVFSVESFMKDKNTIAIADQFKWVIAEKLEIISTEYDEFIYGEKLC